MPLDKNGLDANRADQAPDPRTIGRTSQQSWATQCAMADAGDLLDSASRGIVAVQGEQPNDRAYQFTGRNFKDRRNPYA